MNRKIFIDTEFTELSRQGTLISIALVSEDGNEFYAEFTDYDTTNLSTFVREEVVPRLFLTDTDYSQSGKHYLKGDQERITMSLKNWITDLNAGPGEIQVWGNCLQYDWVFFCELFGGALNIPSSIHFMPMDIAVLFQVKEMDPDTNMLSFAGNEVAGMNLKAHNALHDAYLTKACYNKLQKM